MGLTSLEQRSQVDMGEGPDLDPRDRIRGTVYGKQDSISCPLAVESKFLKGSTSLGEIGCITEGYERS